MFQYNSKSLFSRLPEALKFAIMAVIVASTFASDNPLFHLLLLAIVLAMLSVAGFNDYRRLLLISLPFLVISNIAAVLFLSEVVVLKSYIPMLSFRILTIISAFAWLSVNVNVYRLIALLRKLHIPKPLYMSIYVIFRFLPEIEREFAEIMAVQRLRGIDAKKPFLFLRSILIPAIFVLFERADELSIAFELRERRT